MLYDDTGDSPGAKFATHDLIGSPWQIIVGPKKAGSDLVELKHRQSGEVQDISVDSAAIEIISSLHVK